MKYEFIIKFIPEHNVKLLCFSIHCFILHIIYISYISIFAKVVYQSEYLYKFNRVAYFIEMIHKSRFIFSTMFK